MTFRAMLTIRGRKKSRASKSKSQNSYLRDLTNAQSQSQDFNNKTPCFHDRPDEPMKDTGPVALAIYQVDREESSRAQTHSLDFFSHDLYDTSYTPQVDGNDIFKAGSVPVPADNAVLDPHIIGSCPEDGSTDRQPSSQPFPNLFPSALTCQSPPTFELAVCSSSCSTIPSASSPQSPIFLQSPTSIATASPHSPDASSNNDTDTSTDSGGDDALSKSFEEGCTTPAPEKPGEEGGNPVTERFNGKEGRSNFAFSAVPRFFKASFKRNNKRSATRSTKANTTRAAPPSSSSSSSSAPLVPESRSIDIRAAFPEYASFSPYPAWLVPGSGAIQRRESVMS